MKPTIPEPDPPTPRCPDPFGKRFRTRGHRKMTGVRGHPIGYPYDPNPSVTARVEPANWQRWGLVGATEYHVKSYRETRRAWVAGIGHRTAYLQREEQ